MSDFRVLKRETNDGAIVFAVQKLNVGAGDWSDLRMFLALPPAIKLIEKLKLLEEGNTSIVYESS